MELWVSVLLFIVGILLVMKGGDLFVDAASWIAKALGVPTFIIGATIVSLATTLPEMIVSVIAASNGMNDMAIGNAVGSVTANTGLIMAVAMIFMTVTLSRKKYLPQCILLSLAAAVLWLASASGSLRLWGSITLAVIFLVFMVLNVRDAKNDMSDSVKEPHTRSDITKNIIGFVLGAIGIVVGSQLLVTHGENIALALKVPERVIAVTFVAIGTSLPELVTTLTAIKKKESGLSIGNIIGANIIDLTLILPVCSIVSGGSLTVSSSSAIIDMPACLLLTLIAIIPMLVRQKATKTQGIIMLLIYAAYIAFTVTR